MYESVNVGIWLNVLELSCKWYIYIVIFFLQNSSVKSLWQISRLLSGSQVIRFQLVATSLKQVKLHPGIALRVPRSPPLPSRIRDLSELLLILVFYPFPLGLWPGFHKSDYQTVLCLLSLSGIKGSRKHSIRTDWGDKLLDEEQNNRTGLPFVKSWQRKSPINVCPLSLLSVTDWDI